ncbi:MAG: DUF2961 domain-containing protein [Sedimentisphaerales bacterium]|nr:DUF2961 domain-containing protein [Sedimentisphaerales bacterium]
MLTKSLSWTFRRVPYDLMLVVGLFLSQSLLATALPGHRRATDSKMNDVDLRPAFQKWGLEPRLQGKRGTCSVFTVVGALEYALASKQNQGTRLSVEFLNWASNKIVGEMKDGSFFSDLWEGFTLYGLCPERDMPYQDQFDPNQAPSEQARDHARRIHEYGFRLHWIKPWDPNTGLTEKQLNEIKQVLNSEWPVCGGFRWPKKPVRWNNDVLETPPPEGVFDGHSILLVGYRDDPEHAGGGVLVFRNSNNNARDGYMTYEYASAYMNDAVWIDYQTDKIDVGSLLREMVDFEKLARRPEPFFKQAIASSYDRMSRQGGDDWFANYDVGQYVRTERNNDRKEHVLADLEGPGAITRFWSANPQNANVTRFYFDGETQPRIEVPLADLFNGKTKPFGQDFSYISGTGGNLYYPIPYGSSLKITIEEKDNPLRLYYEIGYRTYPAGTEVETFDPQKADTWEDVQIQVAHALIRPQSAPASQESQWISKRVTIPPGQTYSLPVVRGENAVYTWSTRVLDTIESLKWDDPERAHNAHRFLILGICFDGEKSIETPLGDFFGSGPGVNPYENLFFTVDKSGWMTSRLMMPFKKSMNLSLTNDGPIPYTVEINMCVAAHPFTDRSYHLRAQWGTLTRQTWPPFDTNFLNVTGEGKVVGTVYELANDGLIWWGEGDQKIFIDGESFPSTFGTGTEDDYGFAYGYNGPFTRPYHAQTRVDGPSSGGHISLNRWYVLDALPYRKAIRFDQEIWHWMPCKPTWSHVVYWYAQPGTPGPVAIDHQTLAPVDLGIRENMLDPYEGEMLTFETKGGTAEKQRLANCSRAHHLVWHDTKPGNRLTVHFTAPDAGRYSVELNLCMSPHYGRYKLSINDVAVDLPIDCFCPKLYWLHSKLGVFDMKEGDNTLKVEALKSNPDAISPNQFGLDYIFLVRQ